MSTTFIHHDDHAVVSFVGELSLAAVIDLVQAIDALVDTYFYDHIVLEIASPGGLVQAINHFVDALARWRARDVRVCTRVVSNVSSLGAVLFSLGDERMAEPDAKLLYHQARIPEVGTVTASDAGRLTSALQDMDSRLVRLLVDRAMCTQAEPVVAGAEPSDAEAIVHLVSAFPSHARPSALETMTGPEMIAAIGRYVDGAVRNGDSDALAFVYRTLIEQGVSISANLARTLRLADAVGSPEASPRAGDCTPVWPEPALVVPQWRSLFPPDGAVPRSLLTRHIALYGETGSGKTLSAVVPLLAAMLRAPPSEVGGGLVIDPKAELTPILQAVAGDRIHHIGIDDLTLDLMAGPRWRLDELAAGRVLSAAMKILMRVRSFVPTSALRVLGPHAVESSNSEFFDREGVALFHDVLAFVLLLIHPSTPVPCEWLCEPESDEISDAFAPRRWVDQLLARARGSGARRGPNAVALAVWALDGPLAQVADSGAYWLWEELARAALPVWGDRSDEARDLLVRICSTWRRSAEIDRQHAGTLGTARNACREFAAPSVETALFFGCEPGYCGARAVDFRRLVSCDAGARQRFVVFQPPRDGGSLAAMALKARFFEAVLEDPVRQSARADVPLTVYIADEAHRFATSDICHGEQSFLDTGRSFGACCVLAAQSLSSFEHALAARGGGGPDQDRAAVGMMWTNTATKLIFRTTDLATAERVDELCPRRPGLSAVTRVRPLSGLPTGACYALLADGRVDRRQLEPFSPEPPSDPVHLLRPPFALTLGVQSPKGGGRRRRSRRRRPRRTHRLAAKAPERSEEDS